ncbi:hypothetical protein JX265_010776 [Neoarthrinium moseri]|uniref:Myb-like domain-containing protein n=1 Tax=Neoarthrinium moseri TaxID=1658444 RepID=A0A9P9WDQ9_9PEZI|nr:hypothetical protein JX265_010776 [Neoarthrinium moseri]
MPGSHRQLVAGSAGSPKDWVRWQHGTKGTKRPKARIPEGISAPQLGLARFGLFRLRPILIFIDLDQLAHLRRTGEQRSSLLPPYAIIPPRTTRRGFGRPLTLPPFAVPLTTEEHIPSIAGHRPPQWPLSLLSLSPEGLLVLTAKSMRHRLDHFGDCGRKPPPAPRSHIVTLTPSRHAPAYPDLSQSRASRYSGSRYDGEARRSRSRDRSPDRYNDRASQYSDGGPRRSSAESRANGPAFQPNRDNFRDTLPRDTPRGPRALLDAPSGPRGGGMSGDFRGRGRGGRGRGWRDDSRDRGRDRELDFRDRRDSAYRDERSRERDRDWRDRDRESFRGRRPSPRGRSPPGRDFRDPRDVPLGVDAERARRGSRDGPLSAGSSNSDPPFGPSSYRGGFAGRGRGKGRGDWDRGRGRGFYDDRDRDRYGPGARARSQEGRYRERDDRDRDSRFLDNEPPRPRDPRDERDMRERDARAKVERTSHEPPPSTRDISPPPVAPAAPSFGSVPNRTPSVSDISSVTGKVPPTGPRALKDERPPPAGPATGAEARPPPTGPSKSSFSDSAPPIPSGPRAHTHAQRTGPSSKQWINPNLKRGPESPKMNRSQSFAQNRFPGFRPDSSSSDYQPDGDKRPRSSDAQTGMQAPTTDGHDRDIHMSDVKSEADRFDRRPQSAGSAFEGDYRSQVSPTSTGQDHARTQDIKDASEKEEAQASEKLAEARSKDRPTRRSLGLGPSRGQFEHPRKPVKAPVLDQSSESDDEEFGDVIETQLSETESTLKNLDAAEDPVSVDVIVRHMVISLEAVNKLVLESEGLQSAVGPLPEGIRIAKDGSEASEAKVEAKSPVPSAVPQAPTAAQATKVPSPVAVKAGLVPSVAREELPHPSIEKDIDMTPADERQAPRVKPSKPEDGDVVMEDSTDPTKLGSELQRNLPAINGIKSPKSYRSSIYPDDEPPLSKDVSKRGTSSPAEDDEETEIDDVEPQTSTLDSVRVHSNTPPVDSLPDFNEEPWLEDRPFLKSLDTPKPGLDNFILKRMRESGDEVHTEQQKQRKIYAGNYESYLRFTMSNDPVALKSREKFNYVPGAPDPPVQKPVFNVEGPKPESTRRSRYASERDLERVLEESRRVEDEKRERQLRAEKEKYRSEKEAVIPDQYQTQEEMENAFYVDESGLISPGKIVAAWEVLPPLANFNEEEIALFEKAYLEFPKQWGRVADPLPDRDFGTAIQFYYLKKDKGELNLKEKLKKRPRQRRKGRGKQRSSALVSELADNDENQEIGENGERRRPRRAAAPTFNSEATPATDGENATGASTPSRRGGASSRAGDGSEKPERKPRGRRAKDKQEKQPRANQTLAAAPLASAGKGNRSRSSSRVQGAPDWTAQPPPGDVSQIPQQYELAPGGVSAPPVTMQPSFAVTKSIVSPERTMTPVGSMSDVMAPPPLRPEPQQPGMLTPFELKPSSSDRKAGSQASSYWSVPETTDFPQLLSSFGSDWAAIAGHMGTKTPVMVKNFYSRQKDNGKRDWEARVVEADSKKARGEKLPAPPTPTPAIKKGRYDTSNLNRPLVSADTVMEDAPQTKVEQPAGRFNVPIAAQPTAAVTQSPFSQPPPPPPALVQVQATSQPLAQPVTQAMSPSTRPLRAPFGYPEREREPMLQQPGRSPLPQKAQAQPPPMSESAVRHPLPGAMDSHADRQQADMKPLKEQPRQPERTPLRVKQEPDMPPHGYDRIDPYAAQAQPGRLAPRDSMPPISRPPEPPRAVAPVSQPSPFGSMLQQQPSRGGLLSELNPSPPAPPRPLSNLSRPMSDMPGPPEQYSRTPPAQPTPPAPPTAAAPPARPKTSSIMSLLNDDPPQPKRVSEVPAAVKTSSTPPPSGLSRPPPPPPAPTQIRQTPMAESPAYGHYGRPPPSAPSSVSSMPSLKPYTTGSPQIQPLSAPRHLAMESPADRGGERDYYGRQRPYSSPHQTAANSPQGTHHYPSQSQPAQMPYQPQPGYPYSAPTAPPPSAASPPPQYGSHPNMQRVHEPPPAAARDMGWSGQHPGLSQQQQATPQQQSAWPPKSSQPPPAQSPWAAQHATTAPKPPPPSSSVPPQPSWAAPRTHDPREALSLRDNRDPRDMYHSHRAMQPPMQSPYAPSARAPEPPQAPSAYPRYANTPAPGRDPRDPGPPRSYTPSAYDHRGAYPPPSQDPREAQLREQQQQQQQQQQQSILHQQLRPQDPNRGLYDRAPDRYGR